MDLIRKAQSITPASAASRSDSFSFAAARFAGILFSLTGQSGQNFSSNQLSEIETNFGFGVDIFCSSSVSVLFCSLLGVCPDFLLYSSRYFNRLGIVTRISLSTHSTVSRVVTANFSSQ